MVHKPYSALCCKKQHRPIRLLGYHIASTHQIGWISTLHQAMQAYAGYAKATFYPFREKVVCKQNLSESNGFLSTINVYCDWA